MNASQLRTLVIGGGFSGMSAAIQLRKIGASVDLIEIDPGWRSYGAGITLAAATLRAFVELGILDDFLQRGNVAEGAAGFGCWTARRRAAGSLRCCSGASALQR